MADEVQPPITPTPAPAPIIPKPEPLSFLERFNAPLSTLWDQYKVFLIIFGILILIFKSRSIIMDLLIADSRKTVSDAQKQDTKLRTEENQANAQANELIKESNALSQNKPTVGEDWFKK